MKVLLVTLEFGAVFSGNGTHGRNQVTTLLDRGAQVNVICGLPPTTEEGTFRAELQRGFPTYYDRCLFIHCVAVSKWKRVDKNCDWEGFTTGASKLIGHLSLESDLVVGIDWTGMMAILHQQTTTKPIVYLNYRVFHCNTGEMSDDDRQFYLEHERNACNVSSSIVVLSDHDNAQLAKITNDKTIPIATLHPPLRQEIVTLTKSMTTRVTKYLTCCVRISPEKNTMAFVDLVESIGVDCLMELGIVPLLCGSYSEDDHYATQMVHRLVEIAPQSEIRGFVTSKELVEIFKQTRINVHPALSEAYGMTIVEAAAAGAPTLLHSEPTIGAKELLGEDAVLQANFNRISDARSLVIDNLSGSSDNLISISARACEKALSWTNQEAGDSLWKLFHDVIASADKGR